MIDKKIRFAIWGKGKEPDEESVKAVKSLLKEYAMEIVGEMEGTLTEDGELLPDMEERIRNNLRSELIEMINL